MSRAAKGADC